MKETTKENKNTITITIQKNKFYTGDKDDKKGQYNLVVNLSEPLTLPAGKHYFGMYVRTNSETGEIFTAGKIWSKDGSKPQSGAKDGYVGDRAEEFNINN